MKHSVSLFIAVILFSFYSQCYAQDFNGLVHSTVRIESKLTNGSVGIGTGFMYVFEDTNGLIPVIVTCRHVIAGSVEGSFSMTISNTSAISTKQVYFPGERAWIGHPDTNIDLSILPIASILQSLAAVGAETTSRGFREKLLASDQDFKECRIFQEIKFVGYPIGIWDQKNNLPIARRGMIATDPSIDYEGKPKFLIDASVFPGSSGSPVFIADGPGFQTHGSEAGFYGGRLKLLGIITAVFQFTPEKKVQITEIPNGFVTNDNVSVPINLGIAIKANQLNDFKPVLKKIEDEREAAQKTQTNGSVSR